MALKERSKPPLTPARRIKLSLLSGFLFIIILMAVFYSLHKKAFQKEASLAPMRLNVGDMSLTKGSK